MLIILKLHFKLEGFSVIFSLLLCVFEIFRIKSFNEYVRLNYMIWLVVNNF